VDWETGNVVDFRTIRYEVRAPDTGVAEAVHMVLGATG